MSAEIDHSKTAKPGSATPWVERYRPKSLNDVSHQSEVVATLQNAVKTGRLPHLLFYGPPGSGKTSVALALCRQLWHPSEWRRRVLELNASDERGISVVRDKIKHFASLTVGNAKPQKVTGFFKKPASRDDPMVVDGDEEETEYPNPKFKIIILDEADTVTTDAQAALRRIMEACSRATRFILICNYVTRIIEPLASRCAKFRFQSLPPESMKERLTMIAKAEGCSYLDESQVDEILSVADGDMRRAVTTLQSVHSLGTVVDSNLIAEVAGLPPSQVVDGLWEAMSSKSFDTMQKAVENICADGYSAQTMLHSLSLRVVTSSKLSETGKSKLSIRIAQAEKNMIDGADEFLQLMNVCGAGMTFLGEVQ